jgi:WD40 repeat protein
VRDFIAASGDAEKRREAAAKAQLEEREQALKMAEAAVAERQAAIAEKAKADRRLRMLAASSLVVGLALVAAALWGLWYAGSKSAEAGERRAEVFAQVSEALLEQGDQPSAMLMAVAGDPAAREGLFPALFRPDGYLALRTALVRAYTSDHLLVSAPTGSPATAMTALADGKHFMTFHENGKALLWEAGQARPVEELTPPVAAAKAIAFPARSTDGQDTSNLIFLLPSVGSSVVWDWRADVVKQTFELPRATAGSVDALGERIILGNDDGNVVIWRVGQAQPDFHFELPGHSTIRDAALSSDGSFFAAGDEEGNLTVGNLESGTTNKTKIDSGAVMSVTFLKDEDIVVTGAASGMFGAYEADSDGGEFMSKPGFVSDLADDPIGVSQITISADERLLLMVSTDGQAKLTRVENGISFDQLKGQRDIKYAAFLTAADVLAAASPEGVVKMWNLAKPDERFPEDSFGSVRSVAGQSALMLTSADDGLSVRRLGEAKPLQAIKRPPGGMDVLSPDGEFVVSSDKETGLCIQRVGQDVCRSLLAPEAKSPVSSIVFDPGGKAFLAVRAGDETAELWNVEGEAPRTVIRSKDFKNYYSSDLLALGVDGKFALYAGPDDAIYLRNNETESAQKISAPQGFEKAAFSPDGVHFVLAVSGRLQVWRIGDERPLRELRGHVDSVRTMTFNKTGEFLLTGGRDGSARLWRLDQQDSLQRVDLVDNYVDAVAFDADGQHLVILSNSELSRWSINPAVVADANEQVRLACERLTTLGAAVFSQQARQRYSILNGVKENPCDGTAAPSNGSDASPTPEIAAVSPGY